MLRILRKKCLLKQKDVCKYLGISNAYLSMIENGHRCNLDDELKLKLCELYNITINELSSLLKNSK